MTMMPRIGSRFSVPSSWYVVPLKCCPLTIVWVDPCGFSLAACCHPSCWVPGVSRTNLVKFRSSTGRSVSWRDSNVVATSARSVFSNGVNPVTVTCSLTAPSSSAMFNAELVSTLTLTPVKTACLKPESSALTS